MKIVTIKYQCDYCKNPIDPGDVKALLPGTVNAEDQFIGNPDDLHHYHDYCLEHLLTLNYEPPAEETETKEKDSDNKKGQSVDYGKIMALLKADWAPKEIAEEVKVPVSSIYYHIKKAKEI